MRFEFAGTPREVALEVMRIDPPVVPQGCFIILFHEVTPVTEEPALSKKGGRKDARTALLEEELAAAKEHIESLSQEHDATNEELRSANEEIQSSNEELQSTNEELETAKEEMQSTNEELMTLNEELSHTNAHLGELTNDLNNLLNSVRLPVVMLGRDLRIRRFTPTAQNLFKLIPADVGRTLTDLKGNIDVPDLEGLVHEVIDSLAMKEQELRDRQGRWHLLQVRPYETADNKIAGAVLILFDITAEKRGREQAKHAMNYAEAIVETAREPLLVLDGDLRVKRATRAFYTRFRVDAVATEGQLLYDLGNGQWDIPALRALLEEVLPKNKRIDDFKVEHTFPKIGRKTMLLNACRVPGADRAEALIVLSIEELPA